jgi:uncharacterized protein (TIGR02147 family)
MNTRTELSIYEYLDYRQYIEAYCSRKKEMRRGFSYRVFCRKAGIRSAGYLSDVVAGKRNLTQANVEKFAKAMDLDGKAQAYLDLLVSYKHAKTAEAKQSVYALLMESLPLRIQRLRQSQLDYFSKWYNVAIRELLSVRACKDDYRAIAMLLHPPIAPAQAESAMALLHRLGLIEKDGEGNWKSRHVSLVSKGEDADSMLFRVFRKEMASKGAEALDLVPAHLQTCFNMTMSLSPAGMERLVECMKQFHRRALETVQSDSGEDRVIQVNLHMFPLTQVGIGDAR